MLTDNRNQLDRSKWTDVQFTIDWIESSLCNDENSDDEEMARYFSDEGLDVKTVALIMRQRNLALINPLDFKLDIEGLLLEGCENGVNQ